MTRLEFAITYIIIIALFIGLSWLFCTVFDYIENKLKQNQIPSQTITVTHNKSRM